MKGSVVDLFTLMVTAFVVCLIAVVGYVLLSKFSGTDLDVGGVIDSGLALYAAFDNILIGVIILMSIVVIGTAYMIDTNPVFFAVSLILLIIAVVISMILSNAFIELLAVGDLAAASVHFPNLTTFMQNLPMYALIEGGLILVALYAKPSGNAPI